MSIVTLTPNMWQPVSKNDPNTNLLGVCFDFYCFTFPLQAPPRRTAANKMAGSPLPCTQPLTTYRQLYKSYFQHNVNNRLQGGSNQTSINSLCGACLQHIPRPTTLISRLFNIFVPSVYAVEKAPTPEDTATISEKVSKSIPKIHISEIEIDEYLAKETGMDRLREMFSLQ